MTAKGLCYLYASDPVPEEKERERERIAPSKPCCTEIHLNVGRQQRLRGGGLIGLNPQGQMTRTVIRGTGVA